MDKAVRETPPLECHLDIQWEWKGHLGKIQILSEPCGEQTQWFGGPIVQDDCLLLHWDVLQVK